MSYMHGGRISVSYRYLKEKKAERTVPEAKEECGCGNVDCKWPNSHPYLTTDPAMYAAERTASKDKRLAQNIVDYYFKKNLPLIPPPELVFKERSVSQEEKQMTLDEIMKKVTPEGMYVYLERCENEPGYRFHVHTGKKWKTGIIDYGAIVKDRLEETRSIIYAASHWVDSFGDNEFPRRCNAQREVLKDTLDTLTGPGEHQKQFSMRMGKSLEKDGAIWTIEPHEQIKSVRVLQDIVNEKLKAPVGPPLCYPVSMSIKSGFTIGAEIAEEKAREASRQPIKLEEREFTSGGVVMKYTGPKKCECGSGKLGIPHSLWCPAI